MLLILQTGSFLVKDGRKTGAFFSKNTGVRRAKRRAKFKFLYKKARKFDSQHFNDKSAYLITMFGWKFIWGNFLFNMSFDDSLVATWFTLLNSSITLWTCTKSQEDGQNHKNTGVRRAFFHKCPSRRANPSLDGRLSNTAFIVHFSLKFFHNPQRLLQERSIG